MDQTLKFSHKIRYIRDSTKSYNISLFLKMGLIAVFIVAINIIRVVNAIDGIKYVEGSIKEFPIAPQSMQDYLYEQTVYSDEESKFTDTDDFKEKNE